MDIKLKDFEGPMDLLLHLVSQYKMDIYEVPLVEVIEQYLAYVAGLTALRLDVAGEYMVMASQLILIKSRRLLPKLVETTPLDEDPERHLLQQLEEYKLYKEISRDLAQQHDQRARYFAKAKEEIISDEVSLVQDKTTMDLFLAFSKVMADRQAALKYQNTTIERDLVKIEDMMGLVTDRLAQSPRLTLSSLFEERADVNELITLFLAVLELIKVKALTVEQEEDFGEVHLYRIEGEDDVPSSQY